MANKIKQTSTKISTLASNTLNNKNASHTAKQLAASALSQSSPSKQTGAAIESKASMILQSQKYNTETKQLAASVLVQSNKAR